jgi:hypothetical protein
VVEALDHADQDARIQATAERLAAELNTELTGLVVHRDESAVHAHFQLSAVTADGYPLAQRLNPDGTARLQDLAAEPWSDLGIGRGTPRHERIARGEPASQWVHRSVAQLHQDLPAEIEQAQEAARQARAEAEAEQDKVKQHQARAVAARRKAEKAEAEGSAKAEKLRERAERYEHRASEAIERASDAERRADEADERIEKRRAELEQLEASAPVPKPDGKVTRAKPRPRILGLWPREPAYETLRVYRPKTVQSMVKHAYARRADAERQRNEAQAEAERERNALQRFETDLSAALSGWQQVSPVDVAMDATDALSAPMAVRYGVAVQLATERVTAPPQDATARQVASALYRQAAEYGWESVVFRGTDDVARELVELAKEDDALDWIELPEQPEMAAAARRPPDPGPSPGSKPRM